MSFKSVCWDITSKCNEHCLFCYRDEYCKESSLNKNKEILKKLLVNGVGKISFVGGEPLLYKNLFELIEYGKSIDSKTQYSLTTNALLLADFDENNKFTINVPLLERIVKTFNWITFSLDAPVESIQTNMGRNRNHIPRVIALLDYIRKHNYDIKIKINTVVSKVNVDTLQDLIPVLENFKVDRWKLFKFLPSRGSALLNKDVFEIDDDKYSECINRLASMTNIKISYNSQIDFLNTYITINSEGHLSVYDGIQYKFVLDLSKDSCASVFEYVNQDLHNERRTDYMLGEKK